MLFRSGVEGIPAGEPGRDGGRPAPGCDAAGAVALLNGRAGVSAEMALRLEAALGTSAEMWLEMQAGYNLWQARQQRRPKVESIAAQLFRHKDVRCKS